MTPAGILAFQRPRTRWRRARGWLLAGVMLPLLTLIVCAAGTGGTNQPAAVKISGFGLLGNRDLLNLLKHFQSDGRLPPVLSAAFVEDAALVLFSQAGSQGYLDASLEAEFTLSDGRHLAMLWTNALQAQLPGDFAARAARFKLRGGVRFYYAGIEFDGLHALSPTEARSYFVGGDTLLRLRSDRIFSPDRLENSLAALRQALMRSGYRDATVTTNEVRLDPSSGAVNVKLDINEGLPTYVRSVAVTVNAPGTASGTNGAPPQETLHPDKPYSLLLREDIAQSLQEVEFKLGYPDTTVSFQDLRRETNAARIDLDLAAEVETGPRVQVGKLEFSGHHLTRDSVIKSRISLAPGDWLNPLAAEASRQRLARLGVFDSVQLRYTGTNSTTRNVVYDFKETKPVSLSVLAGYGSYDMLRGGLEFENRNVLGLAHDLRIRGVQSFKSSSGDGQYTVPEVLGADMNAFVKAFGLRREEISFLRNEYGGSVGIQKYLAPVKTDLSVHYDYEWLKTSDLTTTNAGDVGVTNARSAAIVIDLNHDRRVTPLLPRHGLKLFGTMELAAGALGGNVNYQRFLIGGSYHADLVNGLLLHLGLTQGMTFTWGGSPDQLPFNKRYFPGGENSIRGYQEGQASPLDANGNQLGAETYTLSNVELEQLLTKSWSIVAFFDALGEAQSRNDYPWDQRLYSAGGGLCWRTPIGPVRLEYGYNLNPRPHDPMGTLHFSVGFPF